MQQISQRNMSLEDVITLLILLASVGPSLADVATGSCSFQILRRDGVVERCFDRYDNAVQYVDTDLAPAATTCTIKCRQGEGVTYRVCDNGGYWNGPVLKCVDGQEVNSKRVVRQKRGWFRSLARAAKKLVKGVVRTVVKGLNYLGCKIFKKCGHAYHFVPPDRTSPTIICPPNIDDTADAHQDSTRVLWEEPSAIDDRDGSLIAKCQSRHRSGQRYLDGTTTITYEVRDKAGNYAKCSFDIRISVVRCPSPPSISNGYSVCSPSNDYRYGGTCQYSCSIGYSLKGHPKLECLRSGDWSGSAPYCEKIQCPLLATITHGKIKCSDFNNFQSKCSYLCFDGYRVPEGQNGVQVCSHTGHWRGGTPVCRDYERPRFNNCPVNKISYTAKLSNFGIGKWSEPEVEDNSGEKIRVIRTGHSPNTPLAVGTHRITYDAADSTGNKAFPCSFTVNVRRLTCPVIYGTPYQRVSCPMGHQYGAVCHLGCDEGKNLTGKPNVSCDIDSIYMYSPVASWTWTFNSSQPVCEGSPCPKLHPPVNGALACDYWLYGRFCQMQCQNGSGLSRGIRVPSLLVCENNGMWTYRKPLPPCEKLKRAQKMRLMTQLQYYTGDCCANGTQRRIREVFVDELKSSFYANTVCNPPDCSVDNVEVRCNPPCDGSPRHKRDIPVVVVGLSHIVKVNANMSTEENVKTATSMASRLADSMGEQFKNVSLDGDLKFKDSAGEKPTLLCDDGLLPSETTLGCVPCSPGHFLNAVHSLCQPCPKGSYREDVAAAHCAPCPPGTTTRGLGAERRADCLPQCSPGSYSREGGLEPCTPCGVATFAVETGVVQCSPCPPGTTTTDEGSSELAQCQAFDVVFVSSDYQQFVSTTTTVSSQPEELTLSLKLKLNGGRNGSDWGEVIRVDRVVNDTSVTDTILRVAIGTVNKSHVMVEAHGCKVVSSGAVSPTQWQSIGVSLNRTTLILRHNGQVFVDTGVCKAPNYVGKENKIAAISVTIGSQKDDVFCGEVTDVNIWNETLNDTELESTLTSCGHAAQGNIVSWRDLSKGELVGTSIQTPSLCDVTDDCASAPCGNHSCVDALRGYDCQCDDGFTGRRCHVNIEDCQDNACENNATCVDGVATYTCLCPDSFYGNFCEHEILNGAWGEWGDWSQCSVSCGGGNSTRRRVCDSPPPDADGRPCDGNREESWACHTDRCPVCGELEPPDHGSVNCSGDEPVNCTAACDDGYEFSIEPLPFYYCGPDTASTWSHQTEDNPFARIPDCAEMLLPEKLTVRHSVQYADAPCNENNVTAGVKARAMETVDRIPCILNGTCVLADLTVGCAASDGQGSTSPLTVSIALSISGDDDGADEFNATQQDAMLGLLWAVENLKTAVEIMEERAGDGNFTVDVGGASYSATGQNVTGDVSCAPGLTRVSIVCVECSAGTYSDGVICVKCPFGFYQDESQHTSCKACPDGFSTKGTGSKSRQECVACSTGTYEKNHLCERCPVGFYQDLRAQTSCKSCPSGFLSVAAGMASVQECNVKTSSAEAPTGQPDNSLDAIAAAAAIGLGVVIGSIVGILVLVIVIVAAVVFICHRRKHRRS